MAGHKIQYLDDSKLAAALDVAEASWLEVVHLQWLREDGHLVNASHWVLITRQRPPMETIPATLTSTPSQPTITVNVSGSGDPAEPARAAAAAHYGRAW